MAQLLPSFLQSPFFVPIQQLRQSWGGRLQCGSTTGPCIRSFLPTSYNIAVQASASSAVLGDLFFVRPATPSSTVSPYMWCDDCVRLPILSSRQRHPGRLFRDAYCTRTLPYGGSCATRGAVSLTSTCVHEIWTASFLGMRTKVDAVVRNPRADALYFPQDATRVLCP